MEDKKTLLNVLREADESVVEPVDDDYCIKVHLKDEFLFRYVPRRMSFNEKKELEEITDNLLKRGIIKPSVSPYYARVILVNKRNGAKPLYVCGSKATQPAYISAEISFPNNRRFDRSAVR